MNFKQRFEKKLYDKFKDEYKLIGEYKNSHTKTTFFHKTCGQEFEIIPHNLLNNGATCTKCGKKKRRTYLDLKKDLKILTNDEILLVSSFDEIKDEKGKFVDTNKKAIFHHKLCNKEFTHTISKVLNENLGCTHCKSNRMKNSDEVQEELNNVYGKNEVILLSEFKGRRNKMRVKFMSCNHEVEDFYHNFIYNKRLCGQCGLSKGEFIISNYLILNNKSFSSNKYYPDCIYKAPLRFDFYIDELDLHLEFDGSQHFNETSIFTDYELVKIRDSIKNDYIEQNNKKLLRLSYKSLNKLENILKEIFASSTTIENYLENNLDNFLFITEGKTIKRGIYK